MKVILIILLCLLLILLYFTYFNKEIFHNYFKRRRSCGVYEGDRRFDYFCKNFSRYNKKCNSKCSTIVPNLGNICCKLSCCKKHATHHHHRHHRKYRYPIKRRLIVKRYPRHMRYYKHLHRPLGYYPRYYRNLYKSNKI